MIPKVRRQLKYYETLDLPLQCNMLQTTCAGGVWVRYKLLMEGLTDDPCCPRCAHLEQAVETDYRRYWECPDNQNIAHPDVKSTQTMQQEVSQLAITANSIDDVGRAYDVVNEMDHPFFFPSK